MARARTWFRSGGWGVCLWALGAIFWGALVWWLWNRGVGWWLSVYVFDAGVFTSCAAIQNDRVRTKMRRLAAAEVPCGCVDCVANHPTPEQLEALRERLGIAAAQGVADLIPPRPPREPQVDALLDQERRVQELDRLIQQMAEHRRRNALVAGFTRGNDEEERAAAEQRAEAALREHLTPEQLEMWNRDHHIIVTLPADWEPTFPYRRFRLPGLSYIAAVIDEHGVDIGSELCVVPLEDYHALPQADMILAVKCMLEAEPARFFLTAHLQ